MHEPETSYGVSINDILQGCPGSTIISGSEKEHILKYLRDGLVALRWMAPTKNMDIIGPLYDSMITYCTDGAWLWPDYLVKYAVINESIALPNEFVSHARDCEYQVKKQLAESEKAACRQLIIEIIGVNPEDDRYCLPAGDSLKSRLIAAELAKLSQRNKK